MNELSEVWQEYRISVTTGIAGGGLASKMICSWVEGNYVSATIESIVSVPLIVTSYAAPLISKIRSERSPAAAAIPRVIAAAVQESMLAEPAATPDELPPAGSILADFAGRMASCEAVEDFADVSPRKNFA